MGLLVDASNRVGHARRGQEGGNELGFTTAYEAARIPEHVTDEGARRPSRLKVMVLDARGSCRAPRADIRHRGEFVLSPKEYDEEAVTAEAVRERLADGAHIGGDSFRGTSQRHSVANNGRIGHWARRKTGPNKWVVSSLLALAFLTGSGVICRSALADIFRAGESLAVGRAPGVEAITGTAESAALPRRSRAGTPRQPVTVAATARVAPGAPNEHLTSSLAPSRERSDRGHIGQPIRINRRSAPAKIHRLLDRGYHAFQSGDMRRAQRAYQELLRTEPGNRDALLGMAAIAMQSRNWNAAQANYLRILELDPRDALAQAAMLSLQNNLDPVRGEELLNSLLRRAPKDAFLHFSLGNLLASQGRWLAARQAFSYAHRLDGTNADYVFNLAVAFDHLMQPKAALDRYRLALELANDGDAVFERAVVLARIETLSLRLKK